MEEAQVMKFTQKHFLQKNVLPDKLLDLLITMHNKFHMRHQDLQRTVQNMLIEHDKGKPLRQRTDTYAIRQHNWECSAYPRNLQKRLVEITTPPSRKQIVNGLNSGADVFMADFEDALSPTWVNILGGQYNLMKAIKKNLRFYDQDKKKEYSVMEIHSQIFIRPRSLKREEQHLLIDNAPISASIFDITVYAYQNYENLVSKLSQNCYFYIPKIDFVEEAELWNDILTFLEEKLGAQQNSFKVTVIVESVTAILQLDEIVFALRERIVALNTGKWNYMSSIVKRFQKQINSMIDSRHIIKPDASFIRHLNQTVVYTAHRRGLHAIGGASNHVPRLHPQDAAIIAKQQLIKEKSDEANQGFDGSWVVHPMLVEAAKKCFNNVIMSAFNQKHKLQDDYEFEQFPFDNAKVGEDYDLLVTKQEIKKSIRVCLFYYLNWLKGFGTVAYENLMEDSSTVEICRTQLWVWLKERARIKTQIQICAFIKNKYSNYRQGNLP